MDNEKPQSQDDFYEGFIDFEAELKKSSNSVHNPHGLYDDFIDMEEHLQNEQRAKSKSIIAEEGGFELLGAEDDF